MRMDLLRQARVNASERVRIAPGERLLLAVSGGVDSMVLLALMQEIAQDTGWRLAVAHFNHGLRGAASDADEALVQAEAARLGLPFYRGQGEVAALQAQAGISLEMAARQLRHEFLAQSARTAGAGKILTAHHAGDQAELFFLRLFRGAGVDGLGGMDWLSPSPADAQLALGRPLLDVPKAALEGHAQASGISFREDLSNGDPAIPRNRLRAELLPHLTGQFAASLPQTLARTMEILRAEGEVVAELAAQWLANPLPEKWPALPLAVRRRCALQQLIALGIAPEFDLADTLSGLAATEVNGPNGIILCQDGAGKIFLKPAPAAIFCGDSLALDLRCLTGTAAFSASEIRWQREAVAPHMAGPHAPGVEYFDAARVGSTIRLRHWQPGDRFQPLGRAESSKLQDLFINAKIPPPQRHEAIVAVAQDGGIFWVQGLRIGAAYKLDKTSREVLTWRWFPRKG